MSIDAKYIQELFELKTKLKNNGKISPTADLLFETLFKIIDHQAEQIEGLKEENKLLRKRVEDLEKKLEHKTNSKNSSTPPSQDPYRKRGAKSSSPKNSGAQRGHKGSTLKRVSTPDVILKLSLIHI